MSDANRHPYDGKPFYCKSCGEEYDCAGEECQPEDVQTAQHRAQRRRKVGNIELPAARD